MQTSACATKNSIKLDDAYTAIFGVLWLVCCIIYPMWYIPKSLNDRFLFFTFLIIYFSINLLIIHKWLRARLSQFEFSPKINLHDILQRKNTILIFIILSAPAVILHCYAITFPLLTRGDEGFHVARGFIPYCEGISMMHALAPSVPIDSILLVFRLLFFMVLGIGFVWLISPERIPTKLIKIQHECKKIISPKLNKKNIAICFLLLLFALYAYFFVLNFYGSELIERGYETLVRFNSLSAIVYFIEALLFGYNEAGIRLHSVLFSLLSAFYVFRLTMLYRNERTSLFAALILLYLPAFFHYGNLAYLDTGVVFFVVASSFYFMNYIKNEEFGSLVLAALFISTGFLYKNNVLLMIPIIWVFLVFSNINTLSKLLNKASEYLKLTWMSLIPAIPWMYVANQCRWRNFEFTPSNWIHIDLATAYFSLLPSLVTSLIFILFVMGIVYVIWKKRDGLTLFMVIWFCVFYAFFTSDTPEYIPHGRFVVPFLPVVAIVVAQFIDAIQNKLRIRKPGNIVFIVIVVYLIISTSMFTYQEFNSKYVPNDEAFQYIQQYVPSGSKILAHYGTPYYFYIAKYDLRDKIDIKSLGYKEKPESDLNQLHTYCIDNDFDYLLTTSWPFTSYSISRALLEDLMALKYGDKFVLEKTFILGENKIMLFRVNQSNNHPGALKQREVIE